MRILIIEQLPDGDFFPKFFFEKHNYEVCVCDIQKFYSNKNFLLLKKISLKLWENHVSEYIYKITINFKPQFILFFNLDFVTSLTLVKIKNLLPKIKFICWHGDDLLNPRFGTNSQLPKISLIDLHVTPRPHLFNEYIKYGAKELVAVNWYPKITRLYPQNSKYDLSFLGSIDSKREYFIGKINTPNFVLGGYGWGRSNVKASKIYKHLSLEDMNDIVSLSKCSLNFLTDANKDRTNFRNFEIPSQYSLQITERSDEICEIFNENVGVVCFSSPDEMLDKINYYLRNKSKRDSIILKSHSIVSDKKYSFEYQLEILLKRMTQY